MWTEITQSNYDSSDLHYASYPTDAEWALMEPFLPPARWLGRSPHDRSVRGCECTAVHDAHALPMAHVAGRVSTALDGAALFLCLA